MVWPYHPIESRSKLNIIRDSRPTLNFHRDRVENDWPCIVAVSRFHKNLFDSHSKIPPFIRHVHAHMCVVCSYTHICIYILVWKSFQFRPLNRSSFADSLHKHPSLRVSNRKNSNCNSKKDRDVLLPPANILLIVEEHRFSWNFILFFFLFMVEKYTYRNRNRDIFQLSANIPLLLKDTDLLDFFLDGRNVCIFSKR